MVYNINSTRREALIGAGISGLSLFLKGCGGCGSDFITTPLSRDGTGVPGLVIPSQILSNPYVNDVVDRVERQGYDMRLSRSINPPVISGKYDIGGFNLFPDGMPLASGTFIWRNQTSDNHIDTEYSQIIGQSGIGTLGEIIRGSGNKFTVYSVLNINYAGCNERSVFIFDGEQLSNGDVSGVYCGTPVTNPICLTPSGGLLDLSLRGAAKNIPKNSDGASLISLIE